MACGHQGNQIHAYTCAVTYVGMYVCMCVHIKCDCVWWPTSTKYKPRCISQGFSHVPVQASGRYIHSAREDTNEVGLLGWSSHVGFTVLNYQLKMLAVFFHVFRLVIENCESLTRIVLNTEAHTRVRCTSTFTQVFQVMQIRGWTVDQSNCKPEPIIWLIGSFSASESHSNRRRTVMSCDLSIH